MHARTPVYERTRCNIDNTTRKKSKINLYFIYIYSTQFHKTESISSHTTRFSTLKECYTKPSNAGGGGGGNAKLFFFTLPGAAGGTN